MEPRTNTSQWETLDLMLDAPGRSWSHGELAARTRFTTRTMRRAVQALASRGLVLRDGDRWRPAVKWVRS
ncbi:MAG: hypothetical protein ACPHCN_09335 [Mycobacterium sp.]